MSEHETLKMKTDVFLRMEETITLQAKMIQANLAYTEAQREIIKSLLEAAQSGLNWFERETNAVTEEGRARLAEHFRKAIADEARLRP